MVGPLRVNLSQEQGHVSHTFETDTHISVYVYMFVSLLISNEKYNCQADGIAYFLSSASPYKRFEMADQC